ncbi:MAG: hypothetical protein Q4B69_01590 [Slackia sp.]|nr:hypothetical protein [Slackia sp.]
MSALFPGIPAAAQTLIVALVAAIVMLAAFLAASIVSRNAHRKGGERRLATAAVIAGIASVVELAVFGVMGAPFAAALGIGALSKARGYRKRTASRSSAYRIGFAAGLFGVISSTFSVATVAAALVF